MDRVLEKSEKKELIKLLGIPAHSFGNIAVMKSAYKKVSKKYHPDKGGSGEVMMSLNSLWQKFQEGCLEIRHEEPYSESYGSRFFREQYAEWCRSFFDEGPTEQPDLHCDESCPSSEDEAGTQSSGYNSYPFTSTPNSSQDPGPSQSSFDPFAGRGGGFRGSTTSSSTQEEDVSNSSSSTKGHPRDRDSVPPGRTRGTPKKPENQRGRNSPDLDGSNPSSQASYQSTPPKDKRENSDRPTDIPSSLYDYVSHALFSNKTVNAFLIYTTPEKALLLYDKVDKFHVEFKSVHENITGHLLFFMTNSRHRVTAIKHYCQTFCTVSFLIVRTVLKPLELYKCLCKDPFKEIKANKNGLYSFDFDDTKEATCCWTKVAEFAVAANVDDPLLILAHYLDFAKPYPCPKCNPIKSKAHEFHQEHHENAVLFEQCKNQRSICSQASDIVLAKRRLLISESTRVELLVQCFEKQLKLLQALEPTEICDFMAGVAWYACLFQGFEEVLFQILQLLTENVPKQRNVLFIGPVNSGKTTLAAALMDLLDGKALNVNCPGDKLNFELGCALDRFTVVFEDVKGQLMLNKKLQPGQGISNLDNMRDYLDGAVPVNLERKHVNKRSQIFPPSIVTMNEYIMPQTLFVRFAMKLHFTCKPNLQSALDKTPVLLRKRVLQKGLTLFLLLLWYFPSNKFAVSLQPSIALWKNIIEQTVPYSAYCQMLENIEVGESPLSVLIEDTEDTGTD
ncbi:large T antigen [Tupaia glis polyomavirus 1]|uniref:Large T antigen n=1 Tax=Tupaia glis polyomavirus 1 TaxID=2170402 RepID=A0A2S1CJR5_9POLY|nr:large T antigen [Tupaia glis polyomavirus 1]AWD33803.1 large T antigen [Tupaia glis polyomavirus 1]